MSFALAPRGSNKYKDSSVASRISTLADSRDSVLDIDNNTSGIGLTFDSVFYVQQSIGSNNQYSNRIPRSKNTSDNRSDDAIRIVKYIQPKLRISQPGDIYEQEAERISEQVMRMQSIPDSDIFSRNGKNEEEDVIGGISHKCAACEKKEREEIPLNISRKPQAISSSNFEVSEKITRDVNRVLSNGGSSLDANTRESMESHFGYDFTSVRIHTDGMAAKSAQNMNALAYTIGNDIVFGEGQYRPSTSEGKRLLAHELTHVVQQNYLQGSASRIVGVLGSTDMISRVAITGAPDLEADFESAVNNGQWDKAIDKLNAFNNDDRPKLLGTYVKSAGAGEELRVTAANHFGERDIMVSMIDNRLAQLKPSGAHGETKATLPLSKEVDLGEWPKPPLAFKYVDLQFGLGIKVTGEIEAGSDNETEEGSSGETAITPIGYEDGISLSVAHTWMKTDGSKLLGMESIAETTLGGGIKHGDDGFEVGITGAAKFSGGPEVEIDLTVIKIKEEWKVEGPSLEIEITFDNFPVDMGIVNSVKVKDIQVQPKLSGKATPNYLNIAKDLGFKVAAKEAAKDAAEEVGEEGAAILGADAVIIGGMLFAGAATIGASILTIKEGDEIAETAHLTEKLAGKLSYGFRLGASGDHAPDDNEMKPGYLQGIKNFNLTMAHLKDNNPNVDNDVLKKVIVDQLEKTVSDAQPLILNTARETVWNNYADNHQDTWWHSYAQDRWMAWSNIYNDDPNGNTLYTNKNNKYTPGYGTHDCLGC